MVLQNSIHYEKFIKENGSIYPIGRSLLEIFCAFTLIKIASAPSMSIIFGSTLIFARSISDGANSAILHMVLIFYLRLNAHVRVQLFGGSAFLFYNIVVRLEVVERCSAAIPVSVFTIPPVLF